MYMVVRDSTSSRASQTYLVRCGIQGEAVVHKMIERETKCTRLYESNHQFITAFTEVNAIDREVLYYERQESIDQYLCDPTIFLLPNYPRESTHYRLYVMFRMRIAPFKTHQLPRYQTASRGLATDSDLWNY